MRAIRSQKSLNLKLKSETKIVAVKKFSKKVSNEQFIFKWKAVNTKS